MPAVPCPSYCKRNHHEQKLIGDDRVACPPIPAIACPFAPVPLPASPRPLHGIDLCFLVFSASFNCCPVLISHEFTPDSSAFHGLVLLVLGRCLKNHWQRSARQIQGIFLARRKLRSDRAVPWSRAEPEHPSLSQRPRVLVQHPPAPVLAQEPKRRSVLARCRRADGVCWVPTATEGKAVPRAALDVSLLPRAEPGPGCPLDDGT